MAFQTLGLGAVLKFTGDSAIAGMNKASAAATYMSGRFDAASKGMSMMATGFKSLLTIGGVFAAGLGVMAYQAGNFEAAMAKVRGLAIGATAPQLRMLEQQAREFGATTKFSGEQAAQGMQELLGAGFDVTQTMALMPAVMKAASLSGMEVGESAQVISSYLKVLDIDAQNAGHAIAVLTLAGDANAEEMRQMTQAFKASTFEATALKMSLEETAAVLTVFANAGFKGTMGGRMLNTMLTKLSQPSKLSQQFLKHFNITLTEVGANGQTQLKPLPALVSDISKALDTIKDPTKKNMMMLQLFGQQGIKGFELLKSAGAEYVADLIQQYKDAESNMAKMSAERMNLFNTSIKLFKSGVAAFGLEVGTTLLPVLSTGFRAAAKFMSDLAVALQILNYPIKRTEEESRKLDERWAKIGPTAQAVAKGMKQGIGVLSGLWEGAKAAVKSFGEMLSQYAGGTTMQSIAKWATIIIGVLAGATAVIVPIGAAIAFIVTVATALFNIVAGALTVLSAMFWPIVVVIGLLTVAILLFRKEGESTFGTIIRVAKGVYNFFKGFFTGMVEGFSLVWKPILSQFLPVWNTLKKNVAMLKQVFGVFFKGSGGSAKSWGAGIVIVIGAIVQVVAWLIANLAQLAIWLTTRVVVGFVVVAGVVKMVIQGWMLLGQVITSVATTIWGALVGAFNTVKGVATGVWNAISSGIQSVVGFVTELAGTVSGVLTTAWQTAGPIIEGVINAIKAPIQFVADKVTWIVNKLQWIAENAKAIMSLVPGAGQLGPLPVSPGPTPAKITAAPTVVPSINVGGSESVVVIHSNLHVDGRVIAQAVERFRADRKMRSTSVSPGELREYVTLSSAP